jgi:diaminopropionate ammonia-lyase
LAVHDGVFAAGGEVNHFPDSVDQGLDECSQYCVQLAANTLGDRPSHYSHELRQILDYESCREAIATIQGWSNYQPTPLAILNGLSRRVGLKQIWCKDESTRFGLGSFKALGGAYAVFRQLAHRGEDETVTVATATDGNHGRSVAWGAQQFGCRCVIYLHENVSGDRAAQIAAHGAEIIRVPGNYDDSVRRAAADAAQQNWLLIADTSYSGYVKIPRDVMCGYTVMVEEAVRQLPSRPTHVFVQAGVGSLAAAVMGYLWQVWSDDRPIFVVVEPDRAACLYESNRQGGLTELSGNINTFMSCLSAGVPSLDAWQILQQAADFFLTIPDAAAKTSMRLLAKGADGDVPIASGESGCAGLAAVLTAVMQPKVKQQLRLNEQSCVLVFNTEGAIDLTVYRAIVGQ